MTNNEYIPSEEHLWENVLSKANDQEQIDHRGQGDTRNEDPYLLDRLQVSGSGNNPELDLDPDTGLLRINISSEAQCTLHFFGPVLFWMRHYGTRPQARTVLELSCIIMNPFECVYLKRVVHLLENIQNKGFHVELHLSVPGTISRSNLKKQTELPIRLIGNTREN